MNDQQSVMAALGATTEETPESIQYVLIRGLSAMGYAQPSLEAKALMQAALKAALASFYLHIGNLRVSLCDDPEAIAIDRQGEGGHFSMREFHDMVQEFVSERL